MTEDEREQSSSYLEEDWAYKRALTQEDYLIRNWNRLSVRDDSLWIENTTERDQSSSFSEEDCENEREPADEDDHESSDDDRDSTEQEDASQSDYDTAESDDEGYQDFHHYRLDDDDGGTFCHEETWDQPQGDEICTICFMTKDSSPRITLKPVNKTQDVGCQSETTFGNCHEESWQEEDAEDVCALCHRTKDTPPLPLKLGLVVHDVACPA